MVELRRASNEDLPAILGAEVLLEANGGGHLDAVVAALHRGEVQVVLDDGVVSGLVVVRPGHFFGRNFIELLVVAEDRRRRGLGRALLRAAVRDGATPEVFTSTNESNAPMLCLLASDGWELSGRLVGLDEGDPELVWFKRGLLQ